ncbi:MAG: ABC transporter ATP-binding protein, partial [Clostridia bacterium]|nr:ABC transporter ATP-binding protein [Clostridia bacterium]
VKTPRILLLDEPLSNLDARLRLQTREELRRIQRQTGVTTVFVTHDQEEAMSISDMIVVMKAGVLNQLGRPQEVYDEPVNLFVAKFLGTPPINVFKGQVEGGLLKIGGCPVLRAPGVSDRPVTVGIRPEGVIPKEGGALVCGLTAVEVMGRDTSFVCTHPDCEAANVRVIVSSENRVSEDAKTVAFDLKPFKVFIFDAGSEERIPVAFEPLS